MWSVCGAFTVGLFEYLNTLMLNCAQSGRVSGLGKKTDSASSARSDKKGTRTTKKTKKIIDFWASLTSFVSLLVQKIRY